MYRCGKKGAAAVFIILICTTMIAACTVIGNAAFARLKTASCDAALTIGCRSVLSEFDRRLKSDYQIFAYKSSKHEVEEKLENYIELNLSKCIKPFRAGEVCVKAENIEFSVTEPEEIEKQIVEAGKFCATGVSYVKGRGKPVEPARAIKNKAMIGTLPSQGKNLKIINIEGIDCTKALTDSVTDTFFTDKYILETFGTRLSAPQGRYGYFNYEVEYILSGKTSEAENLSHVRKLIFAMREPLNAAHILSDPAKMLEIEEYIAGLPPGASTVTAAIIVAAWAAGESENDVRLLLDGKNVALAKNKRQWALGLENALSIVAGGKTYVEPADKAGQRYEDYLSMLLYAEDRETKLVRVMDLIQINLRSNYNGSFLLKELYTGFSMSADVDGRKYSYVHTY